MERSLLGAALIQAVTFAVPAGAAAARIREPWPSSKLTEKADLIAIVRVVSVLDAKKSDKPPRGYEELVGVDSTFRVLAVLKGKHKGEQLVLFHFRWGERKEESPSAGVDRTGLLSQEESQTPDIDGPCLVSFSSGKAKRTRYLVFLKARPDGRYECVSGQIDPDLSVAKLRGPDDDE